MSTMIGVKSKVRHQGLYDKANLNRAYEATLTGMSVYKASRMYQVPETTLRDRTSGRISVDTLRSGPDGIFTESEERQLVDHIKYMADIGYGYIKADVQHMAMDFAVSLGKPVKSNSKLSNNWFYSFMKRWPELKIVKPQKLSISRAKSASKDVIQNYFHELTDIILTNNLQDHPEKVFNIDETGISTEHSPSKIVCGTGTTAQSITSPRSSNVTIVACGNAIGNNIPPYVFPGQRWNDDFLNGAPAGSDGGMSKSGWSNSEIFTNYLTKHFVKFVPVSKDANSVKTLILYDGHKSHCLLTLSQWAAQHNVILFVLPPHTSHIIQPLDVGIFGPFKSFFNTECQSFMRQNPGMTVNKYNVAQLSAKPYLKAMSPDNLVSAFRKAGVFPLNPDVIQPSQLAPATVYPADHSTPTPLNKQQYTVSMSGDASSTVTTNDFFKSRTIKTIVNRPKRKFVPPPSVTGNLLRKENQAILESSAQKKMKTELSDTKLRKDKNKVEENKENLPSTSGLNQKGDALPVEDSETDTDNEVYDDSEKCCVCNKWQPDEMKNCPYIYFTKWGQCDICQHWVHLRFCSEVKVLRRNDLFRCPHCALN